MPRSIRRRARQLTTIVPVFLLVAAAACGDAHTGTETDTAAGGKVPTSPSRGAHVASSDADAFVTSIDEMLQTPSFLHGPRRTVVRPRTVSPEVAARAHLETLASRYRLPREALASAVVTRVSDSGRGGVLVVLRQRIDGIDIVERDAKVLMDESLSLVAVGGGLHPSAFAHPKLGRFELRAVDAVARAWGDLYGASRKAATFVPADALGDADEARGAYRAFAPSENLERGIRLLRPARARRIYFPVAERLVPAFTVELLARAADRDDDDGVAIVVAADDGRVLRRTSLMSSDAFTYRVYADAAGRHTPMDGPIADFTPHPTGTPDRSTPSFASPNLVSIDGFNSKLDPWLAPGATETRGNNVDAYTDDDAPGGYSAGDLRASISSPGTFDYTYDHGAEPTATNTQRMAAVTAAFYTTNWLHDDWFDVGFDEASGNAQTNNFGRGGLDLDPLLVEVQDGAATGKRNNANAFTPDDGASPRIQMYLFDPPATGSLQVTPPGASLAVTFAPFGAQAFSRTASVVLASDGVAPTSNACEPLVNDVAGKIALVDRGTCSYRRKAANAQSAGAIGVIIVNDQAGPAPALGDDASAPPVSIPVQAISLDDGAALKASFAAGAVTATMTRSASYLRDSALDASILAHEWGHYLHHRLVTCTTHQCSAESEGWGDFVALHMMLRPGDDLEKTFAIAQYSTAARSSDPAYFGIRRFPYSVEFTKNALTFRHIGNGAGLPAVPAEGGAGNNPNSQVHNAGEVWASMLFESYVALQRRASAPAPAYTFDEARRRMAAYVVGGMKLAPANPTFTEQRDAILAFASAKDGADAAALAAAFARRGAGSCAVSPSRDSTTLEGVVESFDVKPRASITSVVVDDARLSCDSDGYIDAGETGRVIVRVANDGGAPLSGAQLTVSSTLAGVTFPKGSTLPVPTVAPFTRLDVPVEITLAPSTIGQKRIDLAVDLATPGACESSVSIGLQRRANLDVALASSTNDDVEASTTTWTAKDLDGRALAGGIWTREETDSDEHAWRAVDHAAPSDTVLESPTFNVDAMSPFSVTFSHRHQFEVWEEAYYDGAVVEVSTDNGATWVDASTLSTPQYGGTIGDPQDRAVNTLKGRQGYVGQSAGWPARKVETLEFGTALAGMNVKLRFRIASDDAEGAFGWEIDDIQVAGITNKPFASFVADDGVCTNLPTANAGPDQKVASGAAVSLDGSASASPGGETLAFAWVQTAGPTASLSGPDSATATFTAPVVTAETKLTFQLAVSRGIASSADTVDVLVEPPVDSDAGGGGRGEGDTDTAGGDAASDSSGCGCKTAGGSLPTGAGIGAIGLALAALVTRRRTTRQRNE